MCSTHCVPLLEGQTSKTNKKLTNDEFDEVQIYKKLEISLNGKTDSLLLEFRKAKLLGIFRMMHKQMKILSQCLYGIKFMLIWRLPFNWLLMATQCVVHIKMQSIRVVKKLMSFDEFLFQVLSFVN